MKISLITDEGRVLKDWPIAMIEEMIQACLGEGDDFKTAWEKTLMFIKRESRKV